MAVPKFYSVERSGYTKVSDLFLDVFYDMSNHGFIVVNSSNASLTVVPSDPTYDPLAPYVDATPEVITGEVTDSGANDYTIGTTKLYINPTLRGTSLPPLTEGKEIPYFMPTRVQNRTTGVFSTKVGDAGSVIEVSDLMVGNIGTSSYDWLIGTDGGLFSDAKSLMDGSSQILSTSGVTNTSSGVTVDLVYFKPQLPLYNNTDVTRNPQVYSFTLEAGPDLDPLNSSEWTTTLVNVGRNSASTLSLNPIGGATIPVGSKITISPLVNTSISGNLTIGGASISDITETQDYYVGAPITSTTVTLYASLLNASSNVSPLAITGTTTDGAKFVATIDTNSAVAQDDDSVIPNRQPWRVQFIVTGPQSAQGAVATPLQMNYNENSGRVAISRVTDKVGAVVDNVGSLGAWQPGGIFDPNKPDQGFINRLTRVAGQENSYPLSYILTISSRGFFLGVWEGNWSTQLAGAADSSNYFNWVLVQRPVDRNTGRVLTTGKAPVFSLNGVNYKYYKGIVRESDVLHPTSGPAPLLGQGLIKIGASRPWKIEGSADSADNNLGTIFLSQLPIGTTIYNKNNAFVGKVGVTVNNQEAYLTGAPKVTTYAAAATAGTSNFYYVEPNQSPYRILADVHSPDHHMVFNSETQVALTEDSKYLLTFPHNLTTPRFRYTEELDVLGTTSADVVMAGQDIQFVTYGEWGPRTYRALAASTANNSGLRIAVLRAPQGPRWEGIQIGNSTKNTPTGATFDVTDDSAGGYTISNVVAGGTNYLPGYIITIDGADLGGVTGVNDCTFTVATVDALKEALAYTGAILTIDPVSITGASVGTGTLGSAVTGAVSIPTSSIPLAGNLGVISKNTTWTEISLIASPIPQFFEDDPARSPPVYSIHSGDISTVGLALRNDGILISSTGNGMINNLSYTEDTKIQFTVSAINSESYESPPGYANQSLYFLYKVNPIV